jgi:hypothetical protein
MQHKPQKRHIALQPLSREHHFGLLLCWKIRMGFRNDVEPKRIRAYADWFFKNHLIPHFEFEETHVFSVLGHSHELIVQALSEHKSLVALFEERHDDKETLTKIETALEQHIRFEERILFPEIQNIASKAQLLYMQSIHDSEPFVDNTVDVFWK